MIQIPLNEEERRILVEILESYKSDLRMEIANTDSKDFRDMLHRKKEVVNKVMDSARASEVTEETAGHRPIGPGG